MIFNIFIIYNISQLDNIIIFNNFELMNILNEYLESGIKTKNYIIIDKILDIYYYHLNQKNNKM